MASRAPGRPRDPAAGAAILRATLDVLADDGYDALTVARIAARAGVGRNTIYRRWPSKQALVLAAVERLSAEVPAPDTGSLRGDLRAIADGLVAVFSAPRTARLVGTLLARMDTDAELAAALRSGFLAARRQAAHAALCRGVERGEVRADADLDVAVDLLAAPFYYRLLVTDAPVTEGFGRQVADAVVAAVSGRIAGSPPA